MAHLQIAIVGGIAGLAAANRLARDGHRITLFEKRPQLQPVALRVLHELQVLDAVCARAARIEHFARQQHGRDPLQLHYQELAPHLHGLGVSRAELIAALLALAHSQRCRCAARR